MSGKSKISRSAPIGIKNLYVDLMWPQCYNRRSGTPGLLIMTFSEFIKTYAHQAYLDFCKRNRLTPKVDVVPEPKIKLCALVKSKVDIAS